jgi:transcriptional regulator with XRE-family HTH domain
VVQTRGNCSRCGARLANDNHGSRCSPCQHELDSKQGPPSHIAEFWQLEAVRAAAATRHFGLFLHAYRAAHQPPLSQAQVGRWLGISQVQVSRLEHAKTPPSHLEKLQRWTAVLNVPVDLLWFAPSHTFDESADAQGVATLEDVRRRDMLKVAGAAVVAGSAIINDAPWLRLAETIKGQRAADASTVTMMEGSTAAFFQTEETTPARELVALLRAHRQSLIAMIKTTDNDLLRRRLGTSIGETEALMGWTLFDLQRHDEAVAMYEKAKESADRAGDNALVACVLGYWSYLMSAQGNTGAAVDVLQIASSRVRGSAAATQAWVTARLAEEQATVLDANAALHSLDKAVAVYDYANPVSERPWTCFFTPSRLGGLTVSTYSKLAHRDTDAVADALLGSLGPTENKVKALVLADLAMSAGRAGDFDRVQQFTDVAAPLAVRTEASLAVDRLWELVELLPDGQAGSAARTRRALTQQLVATTKG